MNQSCISQWLCQCLPSYIIDSLPTSLDRSLSTGRPQSTSGWAASSWVGRCAAPRAGSAPRSAPRCCGHAASVPRSSTLTAAAARCLPVNPLVVGRQSNSNLLVSVQNLHPASLTQPSVAPHVAAAGPVLAFVRSCSHETHLKRRVQAFADWGAQCLPQCPERLVANYHRCRQSGQPAGRSMGVRGAEMGPRQMRRRFIQAWSATRAACSL